MADNERKVNHYDQSYINAINKAKQNKSLNVSDLYEIYRNNTIDEANRMIEQIIKSNKENVLNNNTPTEIRDVTLNVTNFNKIKQTTGKEAVARMIQHILVTKKGTYPNNPDFGVGVEDYLFDLATGRVKADLEAEISKQMDKWLNRSLVQSNIETTQKVEFLRSTDNTYLTLAVFFNITDNNGRTVEKYDVNVFYTGDTTNRTVISEMTL